MTISRDLNLTVKLIGDVYFKSRMMEMQNYVSTLQKMLNNLSINVKTSGEFSNLNGISTQLNSAITDVKTKGTLLKEEMQSLSSEINKISITSNIINPISNVKQSVKSIDKNTQADDILNKYNANINTRLTPNSNYFKPNSNSYVNTRLQPDDYKLPLNIKSQLVEAIKQASESANNVNNIRAERVYKTYKNEPIASTFRQNLGNFANNINTVPQIIRTQTKTPTSFNAVSAVEEAKVTAQRIKQLKLGDEMSSQFKKMNQDRLDKIDQIYKSETQKLQLLEEKANKLTQTGFGLHIVQMYMAPVIYALEQITAKMIDAFSEFDKKYKNYEVKSESYGEVLSKNDFYQASVGQTYGLQDSADAAERFAASGVDVAKSQQALTSVMQVATTAQMSYTDAANGVIQTMQAMHMQVQDITAITDALINSANESSAELSDLVGWFGYAASSAYQAGLSVKQLSSYLGILSSTGTPNTGAAMRQLFLQLSKEDIQKNLMSKFSWIKQEDFSDVYSLIGTMRDQVKSQNGVQAQKDETQSITRLLGGKANAQQALNNLLMAEPELWNRVTNAVNKTGSTQDLYNKITNNSADAIQRIKVDINILLTQMGQYLGPMLKITATIFTAITNAIVSLPAPLKGLIGLLFIVSTALAGITFVAIGVVGAIAIISSTVTRLSANNVIVTATTQGWATVLRNLFTEIYSVTLAGTRLGTMLKDVTTSTTIASGATQTLSAKQAMLRSISTGISGAFIGYMASSAAMQKQMYNEAYVVGTLTAGWLAYSTAKAMATNPVTAAFAVPAAIAVGAGYEALIYDQIETAKQGVRNAAFDKQVGIGSVTKTNYVNIANANITSDGMDIDELLSAAGADYE